MRGDSRSDELTIKEAALVVGGASALAARRRVERALEQHQLPWHWGLVGGRRLKMVYREDLVVWRSTLVEPADAEDHDEGAGTHRDRRDDGVVDARDDGVVDADAGRDDTAPGRDDTAPGRDDRGTQPAERAGAEEAQERVSMMLRDVQSGAITEAVRQVLPLVQEIKVAYERIGRSDAEGAMWRERAERAERALAAQEMARRQAEEARRQGDDDPNAQRPTPNAAGEQRRPWWRFW